MRSLRGAIKQNRALRSALFLAQNAYRANPLAKPVVAPGAPDRGSRTYLLSAMIRVKDEGRFLPEWLAHHANLGVEHVYVYDNNSSDDIEQVIRPFIETGLVTYIRWPTVPASPSSNLDMLRRFGVSSEWVAFFDADEFLVEASAGALLDTLRSAGTAPAIAVNWRYFGSSGHETIPPGLVTRNFDRADRRPEHHVKVVARPSAILGYRNSHSFYFRAGRLARTAAGRRVFGSFVTPDHDPRLVLNHYIYRSREDYERKSSHGFVDARGAADRARAAECAEVEFTRHNEVHAPVGATVLAATAARLADLGYPEELYASPATGEATSDQGPTARAHL